MSLSETLLDWQQLTRGIYALAHVDTTLHADATIFIFSIKLFFDELQPTNPNDTKAVIHKVGWFY